MAPLCVRLPNAQADAAVGPRTDASAGRASGRPGSVVVARRDCLWADWVPCVFCSLSPCGVLLVPPLRCCHHQRYMGDVAVVIQAHAKGLVQRKRYKKAKADIMHAQVTSHAWPAVCVSPTHVPADMPADVLLAMPTHVCPSPAPVGFLVPCVQWLRCSAPD